MRRFRVIRVILQNLYFYFRIDTKVHKNKTEAVIKATCWSWELPDDLRIESLGRSIAKKGLKSIRGVTFINVSRLPIENLEIMSEVKAREDYSGGCPYIQMSDFFNVKG